MAPPRSLDNGDTAQTLDPEWQQRSLEEEANYAGTTLMFCGRDVCWELADTKPQMASVEMLEEAYMETTQTTLRRYMFSAGPICPTVALAFTPPWKDETWLNLPMQDSALHHSPPRYMEVEPHRPGFDASISTASGVGVAL